MSTSEIQTRVAPSPPDISPVWLTRAEVAERLRVPHQTLATWASQKRGPKFTKFGRHTRYKLADVVAWESTQATGGAA